MAQAQRRGAGGQGLGQNLWDLIGPAKMVGLYLRTSRELEAFMYSDVIRPEGSPAGHWGLSGHQPCSPGSPDSIGMKVLRAFLLQYPNQMRQAQVVSDLLMPRMLGTNLPLFDG